MSLVSLCVLLMITFCILQVNALLKSMTSETSSKHIKSLKSSLFSFSSSSNSKIFASGHTAAPSAPNRMPPIDFDAGPPPDLPSLLLHNRIVYLGSTIVPSVTELIIAQLLYLNHMNRDDIITLYINSLGTNAPGGKAFSFDSEAFAIADTMQFIAAPIRTICVGQAYGTAAMLLSLGQKGQRYALPNASIMLHQPKARTMGQASDIAIKAKETLINRKMTNELLAQATGRDLAVVEKDTQRTKYLSPEEAIAYGLIDKVLLPDDTIMQERGGAGKFFLPQ